MSPIDPSLCGYVIANVPADGTTDASDDIQRLIDANPNRTIFFPDGVYLLSKPILTPAHPKKSVDLQLSNFAVFKAADTWDSEEAMVRLGGEDPANDIRTDGSNYSLTGGIIDGNGAANGISIDSGRETAIRSVSIKHTKIGIHIKYGANSGSSDADITGVNIVGTGKTDSIGVLLEGYDNTLTNMRIGGVFIGVELRSAGNALKNIHPLYFSDYTDYQNSCGFWDKAGNNWYDFCYSDHFGIGFRNAPHISSVYDNCFCMWWAGKVSPQTVFTADGSFNSIVTNMKVGFHGDSKENVILSVREPGGKGVFQRILTDPNRITDHAHEPYLRDGIQ
ncbi:MAG: hypothetical protein ACI4V1_10570 [Eubacteriales bacterium]